MRVTRAIFHLSLVTMGALVWGNDPEPDYTPPRFSYASMDRAAFKRWVYDINDAALAEAMVAKGVRSIPKLKAAMSASALPRFSVAPEAQRTKTRIPLKLANAVAWMLSDADNYDLVSIGGDNLSRFSSLGFLKPLLQAYRISSDEKYAKAWCTLFNLWYDHRREIAGAGFGVSNKDPLINELDASFRIQNLVRAWHTLRGSPSLDAKTFGRVVKSVLGMGRWMYALEHHTRMKKEWRGNWSFTGCHGLFYAGLMLKDRFPEAKEWTRLAVDQMYWALKYDFFEDGGHSERAFQYDKISLDTAVDVLRLMKLNSMRTELQKPYLSRMRPIYNWWRQISGPGAIVPAIGDSSTFSTAGILMQGAELLQASNLLMPISHVKLPSRLEPLLADMDTDRYRDIMRRTTSSNLSASRFYVMRKGWDPQALYMLINYGSAGRSHEHHDALAFSMFAYGKAMAIDPGVAPSYNDPAHLPWFRASRSHNMVVVDDADVAPGDMEGIQLVSRRARGDGIWPITFRAVHRGYERRHGVRSERAVFFIDKFSHWFVIDRLQQLGGEHTYKWHLTSPLDLEVDGDGRVVSRSRPGLMISATASVGAEIRTVVGKGLANTTGILAGPSHQYVATVDFLQKATGRADVIYGVLLAPYKNKPVQAEVSPVPVRGNGACFHVKYENGVDEYYVIGDRSPISAGPLKTDADRAYVQLRDGKVESFWLLGGAKLSWRNEVLAEFDSPAHPQAMDRPVEAVLTPTVLTGTEKEVTVHVTNYTFEAGAGTVILKIPGLDYHEERKVALPKRASKALRFPIRLPVSREVITLDANLYIKGEMPGISSLNIPRQGLAVGRATIHVIPRIRGESPTLRREVLPLEVTRDSKTRTVSGTVRVRVENRWDEPASGTLELILLNATPHTRSRRIRKLEPFSKRVLTFPFEMRGAVSGLEGRWRLRRRGHSDLLTPVHFDLPVARLFTEAPDIDGRLDEWRGAAPLILDKDRTVFSLEEQRHARAEKPVSAVVYAGHDAAYLYLAVKVSDPHVLPPATPGTAGADPLPWEGSGVEVFLDTRPKTRLGGAVYSREVLHFYLIPGNDRNIGASIQRLPRQHSNVEIASVLTDDGYVIEAAIPWQQFPWLQPGRLRHAFGFDIAVNARLPERTRDVQLMWFGSVENWRDASGFGRLTFERPVPETLDMETSAAMHVTKVPVIDGDFGDWPAATIQKPAIVMSSEYEVVFERRDADRADLEFAATIAVVYDDTFIYLAANVTDPVVAPADRGKKESPWTGTALEVFMDVRPVDVLPARATDKYVQQLFLVPGIDGRAAYVVTSAGKEVGAKVASRRTKAGYRLEAALPWSLFPVKHAHRLPWIGFDIGIDARPASGDRDIQIMWRGDGSNWHDPGVFGVLQLSGEDSSK